MQRFVLPLLILAAVGPVPAAEPARPNIVLVLADDLGVNDLACYGRRDHLTPNLDALAGACLAWLSARQNSGAISHDGFRNGQLRQYGRRNL